MQSTQHCKPQLKLKNNLTSQLELFVPLIHNTVKWYTCGPTVYSHSHLGHARNYLCNDMIRKVLHQHFGYNVQFCMNITDVDDKIIDNSRQENMQYFEFAKKWEADFFNDMANLGVADPDYLTRVTEYVPEIVAFIKRIVENGYAYESNGSVYFDIKAYEGKFKYRKLKRIKQAQTEAEQTNQRNQKKHKDDFALWKAAKPNQPKWLSPWGQGRPGWHIECSAMATSILGDKIDIHSGGVDLIFPHHQNELAQSQAHNNKPQWVMYFIHVGHLNIKGLKMSKTQKNFITIKQMLKTVPPRVIKLYFFLHRYDVVLNYDPETSLKEAEEKDKRYKNFFASLKVVIRTITINSPQKLDTQDIEFDAMLQRTRDGIHQGFCNNIDTPFVMEQIDEAIKKINIYLELKTAKLPLLEKAYIILSHPLHAMGLAYEQNEPILSKQAGILDTICKFRDEIRENSKTDFKKILEICDRFRDYSMVDLGIRLQDRKIGQPSTWKYQSTQILIKQREKKLQDKQRRQRQNRQKQQLKLQMMKLNPRQMFLKDPRYSRFDENGVPTHEMKEVKPNKKETGKKKKETKCEIEQGKQENQNVNEGEKFEVKNEQGEGKVQTNEAKVETNPQLSQVKHVPQQQAPVLVESVIPEKFRATLLKKWKQQQDIHQKWLATQQDKAQSKQ